MANAKLGDYVFDIDPSKASWSYTLKTFSENTYGGRVVQILSNKVDGFQVEGYITQKGTADDPFKNMVAFSEKIKSIMEYHASTKKPLRFLFPAMDWDAQVFLKGYSNVEYRQDIAAVSYTLNFAVDTGFDGLTISPSSQGLENIPEGIGWTRSQYNTPTVSWDKAYDALGDLLKDAGAYNAGELPSLYQKIKEIIETGEEDAQPSEGSLITADTQTGGYIGVIGGLANRPLYGNSASSKYMG